jgi:hypothetical protein
MDRCIYCYTKKVGAVKGHGRNYKFYLNQFLFDKTFKRGDGVNV